MKKRIFPVLFLTMLAMISCNDGLSEQEKLKADLLENARRSVE